MTLDDLIPRPAPLWPGLLLGLVVGGGGWVVLDPSGPLRSAKVAELIGLGAPLGREWTIPYAIIAGGFVALLTTAIIDFFRVRALLPDDGEELSYEDDEDVENASAVDVQDPSWRKKALEFCRERLPGRFGFEHLKVEIEACHRLLTDRMAVRWGRYYLLCFGLILAAFIAGLYFLKLPVKGSDPNAGLLLAFRPLLAATVAAALILSIVVVAARIGAHAITTLQVRLHHAAVTAFKKTAVMSGGGGESSDDSDSDDEDDEENEDEDEETDDDHEQEDLEDNESKPTPVGDNDPLY